MVKRTKPKSRRRKIFHVLNFMEAFLYANILSTGIFKTNVVTFFTGSMGPQGYSSIVYGQGIGLRELLNDPEQLGDAAQNAKDNILDMALKSFGVSVSFQIAKKMLRKPLGSISNNIIQPVLGRGVRM